MKRLFLFLAITGLVDFSYAQIASEHPPLVEVNGVAEKTVEANMIILQLESFGKAKTAKQAQALQAKEYDRLKSVVDKFKIKKDDFETMNYFVQPEMEYDAKLQTSKVVGYRVSHIIKLTSHKIEDAGELMDHLASAEKVQTSGVTIQSINWDSDKKQTAESAAVTEAVKSARAKAEDIAKAAGVKIKSVYYVQHNTSTNSYQSSDTVRAMAPRAKMMGLEAETTQLSPGQIKIRADVQMQFLVN